ncbi:MAG: hypothetical protein OXE78_09280 [Gammaproteobacteria bacterium]|nr:hypothetical protein [Gammaproteobacteria bacterium]MCY4359038.1 hypothetical protein [Gammaproteobacteria bacterium]
MANTEWVMIESDRRLAIVLRLTERGVRVRLPFTGRKDSFPSNLVRQFNSKDYPRQISASRQKATHAIGEKLRDEVEKVCNVCFRLLPLDRFDRNQTRKDGSPICRPT